MSLTDEYVGSIDTVVRSNHSAGLLIDAYLASRDALEIDGMPTEKVYMDYVTFVSAVNFVRYTIVDRLCERYPAYLDYCSECNGAPETLVDFVNHAFKKMDIDKLESWVRELLVVSGYSNDIERTSRVMVGYMVDMQSHGYPI